MWQRCTNPNAPGYKHYGGRGIKVDPTWRDFATFKRHVGERPSPDHQIERINNNRGYMRGNCRWATRAEQMMNTRSVVMVKYLGKRVPLRKLAIEHGLPPALVLQRFKN